MATFEYQRIRHMTPREGVPYSTDYYKQTPEEYQRVVEHVRSAIEITIETAQALGLTAELEQPLKGYPRTGTQPNYTVLDIMSDMLNQLEQGRDIPSGMLGRWNRVFSSNPDMRIDMQEYQPPRPRFQELFTDR